MTIDDDSDETNITKPTTITDNHQDKRILQRGQLLGGSIMEEAIIKLRTTTNAHTTITKPNAMLMVMHFNVPWENILLDANRNQTDPTANHNYIVPAFH